jgi:hypothetical protein
MRKFALNKVAKILGKEDYKIKFELLYQHLVDMNDLEYLDDK